MKQREGGRFGKSAPTNSWSMLVAAILTYREQALVKSIYIYIDRLWDSKPMLDFGPSSKPERILPLASDSQASHDVQRNFIPDIRPICKKFMQNPLVVCVGNDTKSTLHGLQQY